MRRKTLYWFVLIFVLALALAACGDDDKSNNDSDDTAVDPTPTTETMTADTPEDTADDTAEDTGADTGVNTDLDSAAPSLDTGLDVPEPSAGGGGLDTNLPGCDDLDSDECPAPLDPAIVGMDGEATSGGVTINYPSRYFGATTSDQDVLITIEPTEQNKFEFKGTFEVYFADSVESALAELDDQSTEVDTAEWSTDTLTGTISVVNDDTQDPLVTTAIGAFTPTDDPEGRVIVLKATTTGKFGWYFHTKVYEALLNSLVVAAE